MRTQPRYLHRAPAFCLYLVLSMCAFAQFPSRTSAIEQGSAVFIQNQGQWDSQAQFLARSGGLDLWITRDGAVYDVHRFVPDPGPHGPQKQALLKGRTIGHVVKMRFVGCDPAWRIR